MRMKSTIESNENKLWKQEMCNTEQSSGTTRSEGNTLVQNQQKLLCISTSEFHKV